MIVIRSGGMRIKFLTASGCTFVFLGAQIASTNSSFGCARYSSRAKKKSHFHEIHFIMNSIFLDIMKSFCEFFWERFPTTIIIDGFAI